MAAPRYRIHPAIGISRVGDAPADEFFLGPEQPHQPVVGVPGIGNTVPPFKVNGQIRRQAQRFRIFEYTESGGVWEVNREITANLPDVVELTWTVHLANRKASFFTFDGLVGSPILGGAPKPVRRNHNENDRRKLEIDPLPRTITPINLDNGIAPHAAGPVEFKKGNSANPTSELWPDPAPTPTLEYLGELRTDDWGRLIVIGGAGVVASQAGAKDIHRSFNNDGWFDDVSDGPVAAVLRLRDVGTVPVMGAWILVGPPDFAPNIPPTVTLWDILVDLAVRKHPLPRDGAGFKPTGALGRISAVSAELRFGASRFTKYKPSFDEDVAPILRQAVLPIWTFKPLQGGHTTMGASATGAGGLAGPLWGALSDPAQPNSKRQTIFRRIRKPGTPGLGTDDMPRLSGDDPDNDYKTDRWGLTLTPTQYAILEAWSRGHFQKTTLSPSSLFSPAVGQITPHGLDQAALQSCSGGAFYPGLEVSWQIRDVDFVEPFRIKQGGRSRYTGEAGTTVGAGFFSRQMALPWIADFLACRQHTQSITRDTWGWWPSQRPDDVFTTLDPAIGGGSMSPGNMLPWHRASAGSSQAWSGAPSFMQMLVNWTKFGFVWGDPAGIFIEAERESSIP